MHNKKFVALFLPLFLLLCSNGAQAQRGADQINVNGQLVLAAKAGQVSRVAVLLDGGAKVNSRDRNGNSPLNLAAAKGNEALADVLLKAGSDVNLANLAGVTPLMGASLNNKPDLVRKLMAAGARIEPLDRVKKNAATYAAASGCTACLEQFLKIGTQVNAPLENDLTLLMWAAAYGHEATVRMLITQGAEPSLKDNRGKTAADMAREGNHLALAKLLDRP